MDRINNSQEELKTEGVYIKWRRQWYE